MIKEQMPEPQPNSITTDATTSISPACTKPTVSGWASFTQGHPDENETVWLYNRHNKFIALGCRVWNGDGSDDTGWFWALSNGSVYSEKGKIVAECEADDDYEFTHWCRLPVLPCH